MLIGENIKQLREERKISQYELSMRIRFLNQSQISKIERGTRKVSAEDLTCIAEALQVEVTELLSDKREKGGSGKG